MDRFSYEASFFDLRSQITDALNKCRFLRPIREVCGLHDTDLDLSEDEMTSAQVSSKYKKWCRRNHPDKHRDDMADEMKEAATKLIKEFGLVLQYPLEVRNNFKANFYPFLNSKISILISK